MNHSEAEPIVVHDGERLGQLTTDELFQEIADQGFILNNLYQYPNLLYVCSLYKASTERGIKDFYEFGRADTPRKAIMVALHNAYYALNTANQTYKRHAI